MFSVGFLEICVIAVVALIFVGPKQLPDLMKQAGRFFVQARRMSNEVKASVDSVIRDAETAVEEEDRALRSSKKEPLDTLALKDVKSTKTDLLSAPLGTSASSPYYSDRV